MAVAHSLAHPHGSRVTLVAGHEPLLEQYPPSMRKRVFNCLKQLHITLLQDECIGMDGRALQLESGASLVCDAPLLAQGGGAPQWLQQAGLLDETTGQLLVNERLQSENHRQVFVVPEDAPAEIGPVLEANLRTALQGGSFKKAPLDSSRLRAISCGGGHAIVGWGPLSLEGHEVWNWKDRRDRRQLQALFKL